MGYNDCISKCLLKYSTPVNEDRMNKEGHAFPKVRNYHMKEK